VGILDAATLNVDVAQDHRGRTAPSEPNVEDYASVFLLFSANHLIANDLAKLEQRSGAPPRNYIGGLVGRWPTYTSRYPNGRRARFCGQAAGGAGVGAALARVGRHRPDVGLPAQLGIHLPEVGKRPPVARKWALSPPQIGLLAALKRAVRAWLG
jgi:hypothetical protein